MVGRWRIRHKLIFGMTLVLAVMAFLMAGAFKGLSTTRANLSSIQNKSEKLPHAWILREAIKLLAAPSPDVRVQAAELKTNMEKTRAAIATFRQSLLYYQSQDQDAEAKYGEDLQIDAIDRQFRDLDKKFNLAIQEFGVIGPGGPPPDLMGDEFGLMRVIKSMVQTADDLISEIHSQLNQRAKKAKIEWERSIVVIIVTSVIALILMIGLLRFFYRWVAQPIRDLELGVGRVAKGDFDHRIDIRSGDEIQDLAQAFNDMSSRLRDMYRDLAQQVNDRSRQLVRSERLAGVGFLAAGVAHEINNPLASIAFCSEALERRLTELFESLEGPRTGADRQEQEIVHKYLKMIQEEAFRCKEITQKLLAFSRGGERKREPAELGELIQGVLDMVRHLQNCKGKELIFEPRESITAWVNAQEIKQVFLNLVVNALDSMDEGGTLTVSQHLTGDGQVELRFQDTGCGMTPDILENIFEPFFTRSRTGKGTGLGLSISHRIVSAHGGDIEAASRGPHLGSTFLVRLPLQPTGEQTEGNAVDLDPEVEFLKLTSARRERKAA